MTLRIFSLSAAETVGLLGTWDETTDNDFTTRDGTVIDPDSSLSNIHYNFGLDCKEYKVFLLQCYD